MKRMLVLASDEDIRGEFEFVSESDLDISLPDRITITDGGAYDLEKQGMNGIYTWIGYRHKGSRSEANMAREVKRVAYNSVASALAEYASMPEDQVHIDDFIDKLDSFRVWIELP